MATNATNYVDKLRQFRKANAPLLIFGGPGIGKSEICRQAADGDEVKDIRLSMLEPVDMRGLPLPAKKDTDMPVVHWARPDFLPTDGKGIILFDELNTADPAVQNAALQFILDRRCGPHKLGDGWWIVACGNKASHKAHVNPLSAPLRNRFVIMEMEPNFEQWRNWALSADVHEHVVGFLSWQQGLHLYEAPADEYSNFPTPRSWVRVSTLLKSGLNDSQAIVGCVGQASGVIFNEYVKQAADVPNIADLVEGKAKFQDNVNKTSLTYAVTMGVMKFAVTNPTVIDKASGVFAACNIRPEIAALFYGGVMAQKDTKYLRAIAGSQQAKQWMTQHSALLMPYNVSQGGTGGKS